MSLFDHPFHDVYWKRMYRENNFHPTYNYSTPILSDTLNAFYAILWQHYCRAKNQKDIYQVKSVVVAHYFRNRSYEKHYSQKAKKSKLKG